MAGRSDTSRSAPLNTQAAAQGSYGSTYTSGGASSEYRLIIGSTSNAPHTRAVGGRANHRSQDTPVDVPSQLRRWGSIMFFSLLDVALIVAGVYVLVVHWRDEGSGCHHYAESDCEGDECQCEHFWCAVVCEGGCGHCDSFVCTLKGHFYPSREYVFSETWRLWAAEQIVLKILITGTRVVSSVCSEQFLCVSVNPHNQLDVHNHLHSQRTRRGHRTAARRMSRVDLQYVVRKANIAARRLKHFLESELRTHLHRVSLSSTGNTVRILACPV